MYGFITKHNFVDLSFGGVLKQQKIRNINNRNTMKCGIKFSRPDTKPTIIVIELVIIRMNRRKLLYQEQLLMDYIHKTEVV